MTAAEAKKEFAKLAKEHGLSDEQQTAVLQAFENEKFAGAVATGYARHSEYSSALDKKREFEEKLATYEKWYKEQATPAIQFANSKLTALEEYEKRFGKLDDESTPGEKKAAAGAAGLTREEIEKLLEQRNNALSGAFVDYERTMGDIRDEYRDTFGKRLPVGELEKFMREQKITDLQVAYERWTKPQLEEVRTKQREEERKKDREEWERDFRSRNKMPSEQRPEPTTVLEDLTKIRHQKDYNENAQNEEAKEAFLSSMRETWQKSA
ncbi:MAG TPA: hypothetical protein VKQ11_00485 [Candidatus Sulfotelmatobacter sp.]|nr:hypothetical protein [Candidatus Sulfotelmatobacter sp.]